jgi:hypothetical protein
MAEANRRRRQRRLGAALAAALAATSLSAASGAAAQAADDPVEEAEPLPEAGVLPEEAPLPGQGEAAAPVARPAPPATEGETEADIEAAGQPEAPEAAREEGLVLPTPLPRPGGWAIGRAPRPEPGWTLRTAPGAEPVALGGGPGQVASVAAFCLGGQPWLALELEPPPEASRVRLDFTFSAAQVEAEALREAGAGDAYVAELADGPLAALLVGADGEALLAIDGVQQGALSLQGSTRSIRAALEACHDF